MAKQKALNEDALLCPCFGQRLLSVGLPSLCFGDADRKGFQELSTMRSMFALVVGWCQVGS